MMKLIRGEKGKDVKLTEKKKWKRWRRRGMEKRLQVIWPRGKKLFTSSSSSIFTGRALERGKRIGVIHTIKNESSSSSRLIKNNNKQTKTNVVFLYENGSQKRRGRWPFFFPLFPCRFPLLFLSFSPASLLQERTRTGSGCVVLIKRKLGN